MEDISLHILDIAENSVTAGATLVQIRVEDNRTEDSFIVEIQDNGKGMPKEFIEKVLDPFFTSRTTRGVGLGLSLLAQSARDTGGNISIRSEAGAGTTVRACFRPGHIDMKPVGNMADTLLVLIASNPGVDFIFTYDSAGDRYSLDTREINAELDGVPINAPAVIEVLRAELESRLNDRGNKVS